METKQDFIFNSQIVFRSLGNISYRGSCNPNFLCSVYKDRLCCKKRQPHTQEWSQVVSLSTWHRAFSSVHPFFSLSSFQKFLTASGGFCHRIQFSPVLDGPIRVLEECLYFVVVEKSCSLAAISLNYLTLSCALLVFLTNPVQPFSLRCLVNLVLWISNKMTISC